MTEKVTRKDVERTTIGMEYERQKRYDECNGKYLCRVVFTIIRADSIEAMETFAPGLFKVLGREISTAATV